jgi:hypothetical protein
MGWLLAQEHQHFRLLQQNEASDWADIMPRSGYVLYSNALWYDVKRRFALDHAEETRHHFNHLFNPFQRDLPEYHRARLLRHYARAWPARPRRCTSASSIWPSSATRATCSATCWRSRAGSPIRAMAASHRRHHYANSRMPASPYPVRVVLHPLTRQHELWRAYMGRHQQNLVHQYHNGGIWPFVGGFWVMALATLGAARSRLVRTRAARARQRARRLAFHRVVPRPDAGAHGHGRAELECRDLFACPTRLGRPHGRLVRRQTARTGLRNLAPPVCLETHVNHPNPPDAHALHRLGERTSLRCAPVVAGRRGTLHTDRRLRQHGQHPGPCACRRSHLEGTP